MIMIPSTLFFGRKSAEGFEYKVTGRIIIFSRSDVSTLKKQFQTHFTMKTCFYSWVLLIWYWIKSLNYTLLYHNARHLKSECSHVQRHTLCRHLSSIKLAPACLRYFQLLNWYFAKEFQIQYFVKPHITLNDKICQSFGDF